MAFLLVGGLNISSVSSPITKSTMFAHRSGDRETTSVASSVAVLSSFQDTSLRFLGDLLVFICCRVATDAGTGLVTQGAAGKGTVKAVLGHFNDARNSLGSFRRHACQELVHIQIELGNTKMRRSFRAKDTFGDKTANVPQEMERCVRLHSER